MSCPYGQSNLTALCIREKEGIVDVLVHCSVSILSSLKADDCGEFGRYCKDY